MNGYTRAITAAVVRSLELATLWSGVWCAACGLRAILTEIRRLAESCRSFCDRFSSGERRISG
jgi:hypothetical protein